MSPLYMKTQLPFDPDYGAQFNYSS